jgi:threonine/homoserine efflux transporter RhtA
MKFFIGIFVALAATIVWQTSVISGEKAGASPQQAVEAVQQENQEAGRVPIDPGDCD